MFPVRYELHFYINLLRNSVFKGLRRWTLTFTLFSLLKFVVLHCPGMPRPTYGSGTVGRAAGVLAGALLRICDVHYTA
jgi:hypothetical protein